MAAIYTSSEAHAGPLAAAEVAALLGSGGLPEGTSLWREDSSERRVPLSDVVDVEDAAEVGSDEEGLAELAELVESCLSAEPEPEPEGYTEEERASIEATRAALLAGGVAAADIGEEMLTATVMNCKGRVEGAVEKYKEFLGVLQLYKLGTPAELLLDDLEPVEDFWSDAASLPAASPAALPAALSALLPWLRLPCACCASPFQQPTPNALAPPLPPPPSRHPLP